MTTSRALVFSFLILFMSGGLFLSTVISEAAALIAAFLLLFIGGTVLILDRSHARR